MSGSTTTNTRRHSALSSLSNSVRDTLLPAYHSSRSHRRRHSQQPLPLYAEATRQTDAGWLVGQGVQTQEHEFKLSSATGDDAAGHWASLRLFTRPQTSTNHASHSKYPKFFGGDAISGFVDLNLEKPQTVNSIKLTIRGSFITSALERGNYMFLNHTVTVWDKNESDPRAAQPVPFDIANLGRKTKFNAKLQGRYSWPFSVPFPTELCLAQKDGRRPVLPAPPTFLERGVSANIQYQLVVHVTHGLFRSDSKLMTNIIYTPSSAPGSPSFLRQQAYLHGGFLLPPSEDPQGWHTWPTQAFSWRMDDNGSTSDINYSLSLASPLSYTRGTVLPCFIKLTSPTLHGSELGSLLSGSTRPPLTLALCRKVSHFAHSLHASSYSSLEFPDGTELSNAVPVTTVEKVGKAVWWAPPSSGSGTQASVKGKVCTLEGEIHLSEDLQPTCRAGFFAIEYFVTLMVSRPTPTESLRSFASSASGCPKPVDLDGMLAVSDLQCPVQIATFHREGPLPTPFTTVPRSRSIKSATPSCASSRHRRNGSEARIPPAAVSFAGYGQWTS